MRRLLAWLFGKPLVWLIDFDGDVNLRIAFYFGGILTAERMGFGIRRVFPLPNGRVENGNYVTSWKPANKKAERLWGRP
jgi:hypothetical protein